MLKSDCGQWKSKNEKEKSVVGRAGRLFAVVLGGSCNCGLETSGETQTR